MNRINLRPGETQSLAIQSGESVRVTAGILWLTVAGEEKDNILRAGDCWNSPRTGKVVVQALASGVLEHHGKVEEPKQKQRFGLTRMFARRSLIVS